MKRKILFLLSLCIILFSITPCAMAGNMNTSKLKSLFSQNGDGDWVYKYQGSGSDVEINMNFVITEFYEQKTIAIYGLAYDLVNKQFHELNGYTITVDGHTYDISDCMLKITFGTNVGQVECPYAFHKLLHQMILEMRNAKKEIVIGYKIALGDLEFSLSSTMSSSTSGFKALKKMAQAIYDSGFFNTDLYEGESFCSVTRD